MSWSFFDPSYFARSWPAGVGGLMAVWLSTPEIWRPIWLLVSGKGQLTWIVDTGTELWLDKQRELVLTNLNGGGKTISVGKRFLEYGKDY